MHELPPENIIDESAEDSDPTQIAESLFRRVGWNTAEVVSFEVLKGANPDLSQVFRIFIQDEEKTRVPLSAIVKIPVADSESRRREAKTGAYIREARVYELLKGIQGRFQPEIYSFAINDSSGTAALLIEDLGDYTIQHKWVVKDIFRAVSELGKLHSKYWEDSSISARCSLRDADRADLMGEDASLFESQWDKLLQLDTYPQHDYPELYNIGLYLKSHLNNVLDELNSRPKTLMHSDLHIGNLLVRLDANSNALPVLIDWQAAAYSGSTSDLAKLIPTAPIAEVMARHETRLLGIYYESLGADIADSYSWECFVKDYWLALLATLANYVIVAATDISDDATRRSINRSLESVACFVELARPLLKLRQADHA